MMLCCQIFCPKIGSIYIRNVTTVGFKQEGGWATDFWAYGDGDKGCNVVRTCILKPATYTFVMSLL
jgi:hypothetical protein